MQNNQLLEEIDNIFRYSILNVVSTVTGIGLEKEEGCTGFHEMAAILPLMGEKTGMLLIDTDFTSLKTLTSYMTGIDKNSITEGDALDCIGEISNMVAGIAKARLKEKDFSFTITTPFSVKGSDLDFVFKNGTSILHSSYGCNRSGQDRIFLNMRVLIF